MTFERIILFIGFILFSIIYFLFYPQTTGIVDESAYLSMAWTFQKGNFYYNRVGISSAPALIMINGNSISRYPPGNSVLLIPFTLFNWKFAFLRGYILMGIGYLLFIILLSHFHISALYAFLFLFHPTLILYSRTLMSDLPACIFSLLGLLFFIKKKYLIAGIILSLGFAIRYPLSLISISFGLILLFQGLKNSYLPFIKFLVGSLFGLIPLFLYHLYCFGNLTGPMSANMIGFSLKNFPFMAGQFLLFLNILYPFLFFLSFFTRLKERWIFIIPSLVFLLFFSFQYFIDTGSNFFESIVMGQRYIVPIIPYLLFPYLEILNRIKIINKLLMVFILILFISGIGINYKHQQFLRRQIYYQTELYRFTKDAELIICNKDVYELINPFIKPVKWISFEDQGKPISLDEYRNSDEIIYLACLAKNEKMKEIFQEVLNQFENEEEFYTETNPYYFTLWKLRRKTL
uniref:Glycosyltransferase RgtA/B/C/D-like domain-containing protein n=1 Tax=candidate division WOR-3 bacterium TaxID=2052148 RepID=A0A7C4XF52_UNCW3